MGGGHLPIPSHGYLYLHLANRKPHKVAGLPNVPDREINSDSPQKYTWYVPWSPLVCPPYVVYEVSNG